MTVLVGLDNPYSRNPRAALMPIPANCAGHRTWSMIRDVVPGYTKLEYIRDFRRVNLYPTTRAKNGKGATSLDRMMADWVFLLAREGRHVHVVLFGQRVRLAFAKYIPAGLDEQDVISQRVRVDHAITTMHAVPHPSGRNHWYNDDACRQQVGELLASLRPKEQIK